MGIHRPNASINMLPRFAPHWRLRARYKTPTTPAQTGMNNPDEDDAADDHHDILPA